MQELRNAVCNSTTALGIKLLGDAFSAGGEQARAALTIITFLGCPDSVDPNTISDAADRAVHPS